jgi:hypothetical protein
MTSVQIFLLTLQEIFIGICKYAAKMIYKFQTTKYFSNFFLEMGIFFQIGGFLEVKRGRGRTAVRLYTPSISAENHRNPFNKQLSVQTTKHPAKKLIRSFFCQNF